MRAISRRLSLFLPLALIACGQEPPPRTNFEPLDFGYLKKLSINVAAIDVDNQSVNAGADDVSAISPVTPAAALTQMAHDRLDAVGSVGRAVLVIQEATILRRPDGLSGRMRVRLDVMTATGSPVAFAEAQVSRVMTGPAADVRAAAYDLTRQMMNDMNVEFEYQLRRSLRDYLLSDDAAPQPVQAQPLSPTP